jgi:hypothetical protein
MPWGECSDLVTKMYVAKPENKESINALMFKIILVRRPEGRQG